MANMPMSDADHKEAADILMAAERDHAQVDQFSKTWPNMTISDAYAISSLVVDRKVAAGAKLIGHKIGLTSKAMQSVASVGEPDYGYLLDTMMIEDGASRSIESFTLPRAEIELAFVLGKSLRGPGVGLMDVLRATEYIVPAIELLDTRMKSPKTITDTIADNAGAGYLIIGGRAMSPNDFDMRWVPGLIYRNSEIEETGVSAGVLGHPAMGIAWLANRMAQYETTLEAGNIFLSGSFTRPVLGRKGDTLRADFGPMGSVSIHFK